MSTLFLSLFLIIFVLFFVTLRIFVPKIYTRYQKYDSLAVLPIIILIISILLLNAFGLTHSILIAIALSLVIFLSNLRNFYNLCIGLDRDDYHPLFKVVSLIQNILLLIFLIILIIYFPTILKTQKSQSMIFYGSHKAGFFEKTNILEKTTAKLDLYNAIYEEEEKSTVETEISTEETETEQIIQETQKTEEQIVEKEKPSPKNVIYLSDVFVTTQDAQGTLSYLADKGYNVFAFSFFDKLNYFNNFMDSKTYSPFFLRYEYKNKSENLQKNKEMFVHQKITEFTSILTMMEKFGQLPVYILAEGNCIPAAEEIQQKYPQAVLGIYKINVDDKIEGYIDGFANIQQTKPLESAIIKLPKNRSWDNAKRIAFFADKKFTTYETYRNLQLTKEEE
ncbi:MAG: hypothetical protein IIX47_03080 [Spirochaetaceae bacterium]|nr:hypothetical protein [Spirochaetaceae bacterium]